MKKLCIVHANCQGDPLISYLQACPEFKHTYEVRQFVNYTHQPVPEVYLRQASVFLYQHLTDDWADIASSKLLPKLSSRCATLCIPNMFSKHCWPFWFGPPDFVYGDTLLDSLIERGLNKSQILYLYCDSPLVLKQDLDSILEQSMAREKEKEAFTPIKYLDEVQSNFRHKRLFYTPNHPHRILTDKVGAYVLNFLGLPPLTPEQLAAQPLHYDECELPIHPRIAKYLGLEFVAPDAVYRIYKREKTFAQYVENYVDCKLLGESDFISYLLLR